MGPLPEVIYIYIYIHTSTHLIYHDMYLSIYIHNIDIIISSIHYMRKSKCIYLYRNVYYHM